MSRPFVTMITSPQAKIETTTNTRNSFWTTPPRTLSMMNATGAEFWVAAGSESIAYDVAIRNAKPTIPDARTARIIAVGTTLRGSTVSAARWDADSKPTIVYAPSSVASMNGPSQP